MAVDNVVPDTTDFSRVEVSASGFVAGIKAKVESPPD